MNPSVPPIVPPQTPPPLPPAAPYIPPAQSAQNYSPRKSHKGLIIGLILGAVGLFVVLPIIVITIIAISGIRDRTNALNVVTSFYTAAESKQNDKLYALTVDPTSTSTRTFIDGIASSVGTDCKVDTTTYGVNNTNGTTTIKVNGVCPTSSGKTWHFTLQKMNDTHLAISNITLTGGTSSAVGDDSSAASGSSATNCPTAADLKSALNLSFDPASFYQDLQFEFQADSTAYAVTDSSANDYLTTLAKIYTAYPNKSYTYTITPSVNESTSTPAGEQLAGQRAQKIKNELVNRGVPSSKIIVEAAHHYTDASGNQYARNVNVIVEPIQSCIHY